MKEFWHIIGIGALVITGIWTVCGKDMLLDWLATWLEDRLPEMACKPLFACPPCMASLHGTWVWFLMGGSWTGWPIYVLSLCGLMKLVSHNLLRDG